jgi:transposase
MQTITTIGLDIAKSVFQVHGVDAGGQVVIRRSLIPGLGVKLSNDHPCRAHCSLRDRGKPSA